MSLVTSLANVTLLALEVRLLFWLIEKLTGEWANLRAEWRRLLIELRRPRR